eukprot:SM000060S19678  [mRNA]  locus=s60:550790:551769:+ [translate_table: standard]
MAARMALLFALLTAIVAPIAGAKAPPYLAPKIKAPPCSHIPWYYPITVPPITVTPGTTCTWYYMDAAPVLRQHCIQSVPPDTRIQAPIDTTGKGVFSYKFTKVGTYFYQDCQFRYTMNGEIIVAAATKTPTTAKGMHKPAPPTAKKGGHKHHPPPPKKATTKTKA